MDEVALKAYKAKLDEREEIYKMHKSSYEYKIARYKTGIIVFSVSFGVSGFGILLKMYGVVIGFTIYLLCLVCAVSFVALMMYLINYFRYTHMLYHFKIGSFVLSRRKNLLAILKDDEMQINTLKNKIAFIERERELFDNRKQ